MKMPEQLVILQELMKLETDGAPSPDPRAVKVLR
jgi:hypothetical protein